MTGSELPAMASSTYSNSSLTWQEASAPSLNDMNRRLQLGQAAVTGMKKAPPPPPPMTQEEQPMTLRLVQVFIADTNDNLPLNMRVIYRGAQIATDLTDQELFFEIDIMAILKEHNETRVKTVDRKVKERVEYLEPARIRDLKMNVVTIATF